MNTLPQRNVACDRSAPVDSVVVDDDFIVDLQLAPDLREIVGMELMRRQR